METLKLTSIRLERQSLEQANDIAKEYHFYSGSDVIRTAIWAGLKIVNSRNLPRLSHLHWDEDAHGTHYELEDVLHAAAQNNEGARYPPFFIAYPQARRHGRDPQDRPP